MKKLYLILGDAGVGKSTLVRHLTGIGKKGWARLQLSNDEGVDLWVWMRSAQEMPLTPEQILDEIFKPDADGYQYEYFLLPLRINAAHRCPEGQAYIDLINSRCKIVGAVVLSLNEIVPTLNLPIPQISISSSKTLPSNVHGSLVRGVWGWQ